MLQIGPITYKTVMQDLEHLGVPFPENLRAIASYSSQVVAPDAPQIQLGYDEVNGSELDRVLGYAQIAKANRPIGVEGINEPIVIGTEERSRQLLFPIHGLEIFLKAEEPNVALTFDAAGGMSQFVAQRGETLTAIEYLVGGLFEVLRYCARHRLAISVRW